MRNKSLCICHPSKGCPFRLPLELRPLPDIFLLFAYCFNHKMGSFQRTSSITFHQTYKKKKKKRWSLITWSHISLPHTIVHNKQRGTNRYIYVTCQSQRGCPFWSPLELSPPWYFSFGGLLLKSQDGVLSKYIIRIFVILLL